MLGRYPKNHPMKPIYILTLILCSLIPKGFSQEKTDNESPKKSIKVPGLLDLYVEEESAEDIAKRTIKNNISIYYSCQKEAKEFTQFMLNEAPEKIKLLYAIVLIEESNMQYQSSSGISEQYNSYYVKLLRDRVSDLNKQKENINKQKKDNKSQ
jgi:hypothetical protein